MIFRLPGYVSESGVRDVTAKSSGKTYAIPYAMIRLNEFVEQEISLSDAFIKDGRPDLTVGDPVDWIVYVSKAPSGYLSARAVGHWPTGSVHSVKSA